MRKLLALAATAAMLAVFAVPAYATLTETTHFTTLTDAIPIGCAGPFTGFVVNNATGNGVQHLTVNGAQDAWFTATFAGDGTEQQFVFTPSGPVLVATLTGHVAEWFGVENNAMNNVIHATFDFNGTDLATGAPSGIHGAFDITTNPAGQVTAEHFSSSCH